MSFGQKLRKLREKFNMTQKNVADCIHVSRSAIAGYEKKGRQPSHEKLTAIADLFEVPVDYLLNDEEDTITLSPSRLTTNSDDELNLLLAYRSLSRSSKRDLKKYMKLLKEKDASESSQSALIIFLFLFSSTLLQFYKLDAPYLPSQYKDP